MEDSNPAAPPIWPTQIPPPPKGKNKRQAPKSRTGCESCKKRRRRCDERKPGCYECQRRKQTCPGYTRPFIRWGVEGRKRRKGGAVEVPVSGVQGERLSLTRELERDERGDAQEDPIDLDIGLLAGLEDVDGGGLADPLPAPTPLALHEALAIPGLPSARIQPQIDNLESLRRRLTETSVPSFLVHLPALLVEYYFDYVCAMWSSFDSDLNPFRTNIARLWSQNAPIYYAIQSMAAASLAGDFPGMRAVGAQMQRRAIHALQEAMALSPTLNDESLFYGLLMVGSTTAWHNGADLGLPYLQAARRFLVRQSRRERNTSPTPSSDPEALAQQYPFFKQCLLYWNMLAAFVAQDISDVGVTDSDSDSDHHLPIYVVNGQTLLHPWTGPLPTALQYFYQIARLIRSARHATLLTMTTSPIPQQPSPHLPYATTTHPNSPHEKAQTLETELLTFDVDGIGHHLPTGDTNTPANHFTILADAYRCVALLQIYHAFPAILVSRLQTQQHHNHDHPETNTNAPPLPFPTAPTLPPRQFRRHLALHIIALLESLPVTSGTRVMQPVLLAATAGSLVFSRGTPLGVAADAWAPFDAVDVEVAQARRHVSARLADLTRILPRPPLERVGDLVREVWRRADGGGEQEAFWLDVMMERRLETIMG
ncbi:hypothetical protein BO86DRAFT_317852 [Aspergillus japonicus CBS 114.51]|uniref:Zn(2)-C6 fungal-type domain-containing protein n=1 Tax=Aspergillus japonicus CBS 114.51 TaxID=1448312 RepID=A0A8T8WV81_ASPJA|nr:hypothetical protein BO86DRAFT_317852 [Aspergillus japonicus CBS 114.51]RAH79745.1 hypothetical protein BO86DRAFT_317852 [Aspergillus japonicus CBS 114.51]